MFYQQVANYSGINFKEDEMTLLNKGLMYNIPAFKNKFIIHEIICVEAAIKNIDYVSYQVETCSHT